MEENKQWKKLTGDYEKTLRKLAASKVQYMLVYCDLCNHLLCYVLSDTQVKYVYVVSSPDMQYNATTTQHISAYLTSWKE